MKPKPNQQLTIPTPPKPSTIAAIAKAIDAVKREIQPVLDKVSTTPITSIESNLSASSTLHELKEVTKTIESGLDPIIKPVREFLDAMYALRRDLETPRAAAEIRLKRLMADWELAENKRKKAEDDARIKKEQEERRIALAAIEQERLAEAQKLATQADQAREDGNPQLAAAMQQKAEDTVLAPMPEIAIATFPTTLTPPPPKPAYSSSTPVKKWRVTDRELLMIGIIEELVPAEVDGLPVMVVNETAVNKAMRGEGWRNVAKWVGVDVTDDVRISGR